MFFLRVADASGSVGAKVVKERFKAVVVTVCAVRPNKIKRLRDQSVQC